MEIKKPNMLKKKLEFTKRLSVPISAPMNRPAIISGELIQIK